MARQVLENGVIIPAEYSDDWYDDMTSNLTKLDDVIGSDSEKLSSSDVGAAALSNSYNDLDNLPTIPTKTSDLTNDSNFVDTSNSAVSSGITSAKVTDYDTHIADTDIHVTTADKATWNTVTSKANDSDVVHKSGDETISGNKTFSSINGVEPSSLGMPSDRSARIDISSYFTDTSSGGVNRYTAPSNGFVYLLVADVITIHLFSQDLSKITNFGDTRGRATAGQLYAFLPVRNGDIFTSQWYTTLTNVSLTSAYFIPCQGNV